MTTRVEEGAGLGGAVDGQRSARCPSCGVTLELLPNAEVAPALASFDVHHPGDGSAVHAPGLPWGWRMVS